jgi:hypothetical protein
MKRRALLSLCATPVVGGCLGQATVPETRIAWLWFVNDRDEADEVDIIKDGGETVFADTYTAGTDGNDANFHVDSPVDGTGQYVVRATMNGEVEEVDTTDFVEDGENCIGVRFSFLNNGMEEYWVKSMQRC